jgi:NAD(P)H-dependent flavin oxidoreductase YrpB (nitropropane dioxygenase family)
MPPRWNENRLTTKFGIGYPIIQGPLGGLSSQRLTAAVSNFGGLGSFGAHGLTPEAIKDGIVQIRSLTSKPFAMNLWVFSFIYGIPPREILEECRAKRIVTIGTATTPEEGAALQEAGVDAIVASGFEAGGHRGSFLRAAKKQILK